jgi:DNA polymerase-4
MLRDAAYELFDREKISQPVRLIGFGVSHLVGAGEAVKREQMLFSELEPKSATDGRNAALDRAVDALRASFGQGAIKRGIWKKHEG